MSWTDDGRTIRVSVRIHDEAPASLRAHVDLQVALTKDRLALALRDLQLPPDLIEVEVE